MSFIHIYYFGNDDLMYLNQVSHIVLRGLGQSIFNTEGNATVLAMICFKLPDWKIATA